MTVLGATLCDPTVTVMNLRGTEVRRRLIDANTALKELQKKSPSYTEEYFSQQWARQKRLQSQAISESVKEKQERLIVLLKLEEELLEARTNLEALQATRVRTRTVDQRNLILNLPATLAVLERKVQEVSYELGSEEFLQLESNTDRRAKPLLTIQMYKSQLYEAKVGVVELQRTAKKTNGASKQARVQELRTRKKVILRKKYNTFQRHASTYNDTHQPTNRIQIPSYDEICAMPIDDMFWDVGTLSHPDEAWATDNFTKKGIQAYLTKRGCVEELRRMAREVRQAILWALDYQTRVDGLKPTLLDDVNRVEKEALHARLSKAACLVWRQWDWKLSEVIHWSASYLDDREESDLLLQQRWRTMYEKSMGEWRGLVQFPNLIAEGGEGENEEALGPIEE